MAGGSPGGSEHPAPSSKCEGSLGAAARKLAPGRAPPPGPLSAPHLHHKGRDLGPRRRETLIRPALAFPAGVHCGSEGPLRCHMPPARARALTLLRARGASRARGSAGAQVRGGPGAGRGGRRSPIPGPWVISSQSWSPRLRPRPLRMHIHERAESLSIFFESSGLRKPREGRGTV